MKNIRIFYLKIFIFFVVKFSVYLNRRVFVMRIYTKVFVQTLTITNLTDNYYIGRAMFLVAYADRADPDQPVHLRSLIRTFIVH